MDTPVIKFNPLPNALWSAPKDHYFAFVGIMAGLVVAAVVSRVVIRRVGFELGCAGINQAIAGDQAKARALGADVLLGASGQMSDLAVGEPERFGFGQLVNSHGHV